MVKTQSLLTLMRIYIFLIQMCTCIFTITRTYRQSHSYSHVHTFNLFSFILYILQLWRVIQTNKQKEKHKHKIMIRDEKKTISAGTREYRWWSTYQQISFNTIATDNGNMLRWHREWKRMRNLWKYDQMGHRLMHIKGGSRPNHPLGKDMQVLRNKRIACGLRNWTVSDYVPVLISENGLARGTYSGQSCRSF